MADPARNENLPEIDPSSTETIEGSVLDEEQVLETLEGSPPPPTIDAPRGIAIGVGLGAVIWLIAFAVYVFVW